MTFSDGGLPRHFFKRGKEVTGLRKKAQGMQLQKLLETPASTDRRGEFIPQRISVIESSELPSHVTLEIWSGDNRAMGATVRVALTCQDVKTLAGALIEASPGNSSLELLGLIDTLVASAVRAGIATTDLRQAMNALCDRHDNQVAIKYN